METKQLPPAEMAVPPGELLARYLEEAELTQAELARRMGRPSQAISEIVRGKKAITAETALELEDVTGLAAHIWLGLEARYRLARARKLRRRAS